MNFHILSELTSIEFVVNTNQAINGTFVSLKQPLQGGRFGIIGSRNTVATSGKH